jgi:hypothetical protein
LCEKSRSAMHSVACGSVEIQIASKTFIHFF